MYSPNLFYDSCAKPTKLNDVLKQMKIVIKSKYSIKNLSIVNCNCNDAHEKKIQHSFIKCINDYYKEDPITIFHILKQQHYQTLIITKDSKFVGGALYVLSPLVGSFIFFLHIEQSF